MKFKLVFSDGFVEDLKKFPLAMRKRVMKKVDLLAENPAYPSLRVKKIKGWDDIFECSVNMDVRIIWRYDGEKIILLMHIGHHDILKRY